MDTLGFILSLLGTAAFVALVHTIETLIRRRRWRK